MLRLSRRELDQRIVDSAAAVFARHGFKQTPIQAVADAIGYSKAGLLSHFPSKEALQDAVIARCLSGAEQVHATVKDLAPGPVRDRAAVTAVVDFSEANPGCLALMLSVLGPASDQATSDRLEPVRRHFFDAFSADETATDERLLRIGSALGALAVTSLGVQVEGRLHEVRHLIIQASYDALGHDSQGDK